MHFLNSFFLMNALLLPPTHSYVALRMILWACIGALGFREGYRDIETWNTPERKENRIEGRYRWLGLAVVITESLVCYKYREGTGHITDTPTPLYISIPWVGASLYLGIGYLYLRFKPDHSVKYPGIGTAADKVMSDDSTPKKQRKTLSPLKKLHKKTK